MSERNKSRDLCRHRRENEKKSTSLQLFNSQAPHQPLPLHVATGAAVLCEVQG